MQGNDNLLLSKPACIHKSLWKGFCPPQFLNRGFPSLRKILNRGVLSFRKVDNVLQKQTLTKIRKFNKTWFNNGQVTSLYNNKECFYNINNGRPLKVSAFKYSIGIWSLHSHITFIFWLLKSFYWSVRLPNRIRDNK